MLDKLKDLCLLDGISGDEGAVREYIIDKIGDKAEIRVDNLGNVIAFCKGKKTPKNKIMVSAHMDEVGMIVTYVNSDGTLKVSSVGGVDPRVVFGRRVKIGRNNVLGVVGGKAIHNLTAEERKKSVPFDKLTIDIGVDSREEALKLVRLGDSVRFVSDFVEFGEGFVKCKAIDDRAGCAIMLRMIEEGMEYDTYFTFVVQEEIGLRGSTCARSLLRLIMQLCLNPQLRRIFHRLLERKGYVSLEKVLLFHIWTDTQCMTVSFLSLHFLRQKRTAYHARPKQWWQEEMMQVRYTFPVVA